MAQHALWDFLREKKKRADETSIDWAARRGQWHKAIGDLYRKVEQWLAPLKQEGVVTTSKRMDVVSEEPLGDYDVPILTLHVGGEKVEFVPRGTFVVGASGRVDVVGDLGEADLILVDGKWQVVVSRTPTRRVGPLTKDSLHDVLARVMRR